MISLGQAVRAAHHDVRVCFYAAKPGKGGPRVTEMQRTIHDIIAGRRTSERDPFFHQRIVPLHRAGCVGRDHVQIVIAASAQEASDVPAGRGGERSRSPNR